MGEGWGGVKEVAESTEVCSMRPNPPHPCPLPQGEKERNLHHRLDVTLAVDFRHYKIQGCQNGYQVGNFVAHCHLAQGAQVGKAW